MNMFDLTARRARLNPDHLALEDLADGTRYTYRELDEQAARFAAAAAGCWNLQAGARIAWLGHNRAEFFAMLFGCAKAGLILVPLNWRLAIPELEVLLDDSQPDVLIYGAEFASTAAQLAARHPAPLQLVALDHSPENHRHYGTDLASVTPDLTPCPERDPDSPWYLLYTSGTTSRPKGVIQTFRMMMANYLNIGLAVRLNADDVLLNVLPVFHTAGINLYSSALLMLGGTVLVQRTFDASQALDILAGRATIFFGVPAIYQALLEHPAFAGERLQRVRSWGCGGAAMPVAVAQRYAQAGILVRTGMGMTEAGPTVFLLDEDQVLRKPGAAGRPQLVTEVRIVDRAGRDVAPGEAGELLVRGPGVTPGYWQRPEATAEAMLPDGWLRTGDVARCDEEGDYTIVDRWKDMFISGGENVYPAEVEAVLLQHPDIAEAAVVGMADERWGEVGHASIVLTAGVETLDLEALRRFCRERLAGYKVPKVFQLREALPRNALGKVIKQELRDAAHH
ncbi:AMP-binding protein [Kerstersia similis]|uniref:AMP-binding protein n=1 Tax=Kerstersia similis TaxID=206505 RepID=UPI0039F0B664